MTPFRSILPALILASAATPVTGAPATRHVSYNRDVRPILADNCFSCHGADPSSRKDDLRLDRFEDATAPRDDKPGVIVPGQPDASEFVARIESHEDPMPPEKSRKTLTEAQKQTLRLWVQQGAQYQPHWAFVPPVRPAEPKTARAAEAKNPIDHFVWAKLEEHGLAPNGEADKFALVRRVSLDLIGVPPTPTETQAFVSDESDSAYEKLVDRLLASPLWGEHRARFWLDLARYGDTHGLHFDNQREMWSYRDWVIEAFNRNMPFDQFTREQLAGDLLPGATLEQKIATGFNRCHTTTNEGGAIPEEYLALYARDRTDTVAQVWLGLTAGCAVCHDHKYDPITQKDFYSMSAFFSNTTQAGMDGNLPDTPPAVVVPRPEERAYYETLQTEILAAKAKLQHQEAVNKRRFSTWVADPGWKAAEAQPTTRGLVLHVPLHEKPSDLRTILALVNGRPHTLVLPQAAIWQGGAVGPDALTIVQDGVPSVDSLPDIDRDQPFSVAFWAYFFNQRDGVLLARMDDQNNMRGIEVSVEKQGHVAVRLVHRWPDDALKIVAQQSLPRFQWTHVAATYDGSSQYAGLKLYINGEAQDIELQANSLRNTIRTGAPWELGKRRQSIPTKGNALQDVRIYNRSLKAEEVQRLAHAPRLAWLAKQIQARGGSARVGGGGPRGGEQAWREEAEAHFGLLFDDGYRKAKHELALLQRAEAAIRARGTVAHVMNEKPTAPEAYVLIRGEYDKLGERVDPNVPQALPPMPAAFPKNRLGFADWLFLETQPLTARVTVNRIWQELFGVGFVSTPGDFGTTAELPSHPELLDWLALEFRSMGWDLKRLYKLIVMSATYRQSAVARRKTLLADPDNRLLSRGPRFRLDAEVIRDYALFASGLLVQKLGGPSVRPYQPEQVWEAVAMPESNTHSYKQDVGESLYRRSVYTFWKRSAPPAALEVFNAPSRETCTVRRERTNTPLQALAGLNDLPMIEAARRLAENAIKHGGSAPHQWLKQMASHLLIRPLRADETKLLLRSFERMKNHYRTHRQAANALIHVGEAPVDPSVDAAHLAALTLIGNELLNLHETITK